MSGTLFGARGPIQTAQPPSTAMAPAPLLLTPFLPLFQTRIPLSSSAQVDQRHLSTVNQATPSAPGRRGRQTESPTLTDV